MTIRAKNESIAEFLVKRLPVTSVRNIGEGQWRLTCSAPLGNGPDADLNVPFTVVCDESAGSAVFRHTLDFEISASNEREAERLLALIGRNHNGITPEPGRDGIGLQLVYRLDFSGADGQPAVQPDSVVMALVEALVVTGPLLHAVAVDGVDAEAALKGRPAP